jgi:hypothetical protein
VTEAPSGYHLSMDPEARQPVHLNSVPLDELIALQLYFDDMVRELQLIAVGAADDRAAYRLHRLAIHTQHEIARARTELHLQTQAHIDEGRHVADLVIDLRPSAVPATQALIPLVDAFDEASRGGTLLTTPCTDASRRLLSWLVEEVEAQLETHRAPQPYPGAVT